ncbi:uncharacterized protein LOC115890514 [Sitophilus oryzae]|uniref:Uncharacterized protein LOC115890514 n=1 Tax=Sitophilus oryzae TaxID=7048 RepID=A0A6J2YTJ5_SITOR|nr:uncharacterized protein LOC115890514 [Sitophilus oryzae]
MEVHVDSIGGLSHRQYRYRKGISTIDGLDGTEIKWSKSLRYLGVQIDKKLNFKEHIHAVVVKAQTTVAKLARVMPNIGSPRQEKRILLNEVVHDSILYAAPIWAKALEVKKEKQKLLSVQRRSALRFVSA